MCELLLGVITFSPEEPPERNFALPLFTVLFLLDLWPARMDKHPGENAMLAAACIRNDDIHHEWMFEKM